MDTYKNLTVLQLRTILKSRNLKTNGVKDELINRLLENDIYMSNNNLIKIVVYTLMGQFCELNFCLNKTVFELKYLISRIKNIPIDKIILRQLINDVPNFGDIIHPNGYVSRELIDYKTLLDNNINNNVSIELQLKI